ncbi:MAG: cell division protein FtsA [Campylobacterales bacterium]
MSSILAIDIGSSKVCALIARWQDETLQLMGSGIAKAQGLKKGSIVNIDLASRAIRTVVNDARHQAGVDPERAIVSVSGAYVRSVNSYGIANIPTKEITVKDVNRAMQTAVYNANVPADYEILHALPYNFKVDDQQSIQDPVGMSGGRLEASVHIVIAQKSALENLRKTVQSAGVEIENMVLSGYAASIAVLSDDEKDLGVCVIDIGGSTSNLVIHYGNAPRYNDFLAVGGSHITGDLSMALHTPPSVAERVKIDHGSLISHSDNLLEIPKIGNENATQQVSLETVSNVIYARMEETLMILSRQLDKSHFKNNLGAGIVITGGAAKHEGLQEIAAPIFDNLPVRIARPKPMAGLLESLRDPAFAVVLGLVRYGAGEYTLYEIDSNKMLRSRFRSQGREALEEQPAEESPVVREIVQPARRGEVVARRAEEKESIADIMMTEPQPEGVSELWQKFWRRLSQIF